MKRILGACLVMAALASSATASSHDCLTWTDAAGDVDAVHADNVALTPEPQLVPPLDLLSVDLSASTAGVSAVFRPASLAEPPTGATYAYTAEFEDAVAVYQLEVTRNGPPASTPIGFPYELNIAYKDAAPSPVPGLRIQHSERIEVTGSVDTAAGEIRITAPASAFPAPLTLGRSWTVGELQAVAGPMGFTYGPWDDIDEAEGDPFEVGTGC